MHIVYILNDIFFFYRWLYIILCVMLSFLIIVNLPSLIYFHIFLIFLSSLVSVFRFSTRFSAGFDNRPYIARAISTFWLVSILSTAGTNFFKLVCENKIPELDLVIWPDLFFQLSAGPRIMAIWNRNWNINTINEKWKWLLKSTVVKVVT